VRTTSVPGTLRAISLVAVVATSMALPATSLAARRVTIDDFMTGLACVESSGRYDALNASSGSYGKYQVMPRIWPAWAQRYLGNRWALPTPRNQEYVVRQRILDLYRLHHSWSLVAHWWLTGNARSDEELWSRAATSYVDSVTGIAHLAASPTKSDWIPARCFPKPFATPQIRTVPWPRVHVTGQRVYLRNGPGYENRAIGIVKRGQRLHVLGSGRDPRGKQWLRAGLRDGSQAWIAGWYTHRLGQ
jgi:hypothetical protein